MRFVPLFALLLACTLIPEATPPSPNPLAAVDLARLDRSIRREPAYLSGSPKYCLAVFGPQAQTRVWLVLDLASEPWKAEPDRNMLYVDRNGDGDLTSPSERVRCELVEATHHFSFSTQPSKTYSPRFRVGEIADGTVSHADLTVEVDSYLQDYRPCSLSVMARGQWKQFAGGGILRFGGRPESAPVVHFDGPMTLRLKKEGSSLHVPISYDPDGPARRQWYEEHPPKYEECALTRGVEGDLNAQFGTPGLGQGTFATFATDAIPVRVYPVAEVQFATDEIGQTPMAIRVALNQRC